MPETIVGDVNRVSSFTTKNGEFKEMTGWSAWCALFFRIHMLMAETFFIAAYYAWFAYFDMILGNSGHVEDLVQNFEERVNCTRVQSNSTSPFRSCQGEHMFSPFVGWVIFSIVVTIVSHSLVFTYMSRIAYKLAALHYEEHPDRLSSMVNYALLLATQPF